MCGSPDGITPSQQEAVKSFAELVQCDLNEAKSWLSITAWSVDRALSLFFKCKEQGHPRPQVAPPLPIAASCTRPVKKACSASSVSAALPSESLGTTHWRSPPTSPPPRLERAQKCEASENGGADSAGRSNGGQESSSQAFVDGDLAATPSRRAKTLRQWGVKSPQWGVKSPQTKPFQQLGAKEWGGLSRLQVGKKSAPALPFPFLQRRKRTFPVAALEVVDLTEDENSQDEKRKEPVESSLLKNASSERTDNYRASIPPSPSELPDDFSLYLGSFVATGNVTSVQKIVISAKLSLVVQTQIPQASSRQGASTGRRSKLVKSNARMVYVEMEDPLLKSLQQRLVSCGEGTLTSPSKPEKSDLNSPASSSRCASILQKVDFLQLLSNVSEKTSCLRMNVKGLDAVRFDRAVEPSWIPGELPQLQQTINASVKLRFDVYATANALRLSEQKHSKKALLSQLEMASLVGQSWSDLCELLKLKRLSPAPSSNSSSPALANSKQPNTDALLHKRMLAIQAATSLRRRSSRNACADTQRTEAVPPSQESLLLDFDEEKLEVASNSSGGSQTAPGNLVEEDDAAEEESLEDEAGLELSKIVLGEGEEEEEAASAPRRRQRRLGRLHPPSKVFKTRLRPYQAEGVWWMAQCEAERARVLSEEEAELLDPLWTQFELPPQPTFKASTSAAPQGAVFRPAVVFFNFSAGLVSLQTPLVTGRVRGGVLADSMGLGKTVQVLALIAWSLLFERAPQYALRLEHEGKLLESQSDGGPFLKAETKETKDWRRPPTASPCKGQAKASIEKEASEEETTKAAPPSASADASLDEQLKAPDPKKLASQLLPDAQGRLRGGSLLVVPLSVLDQWRLEAEKHLAEGVASLAVYYGPSRSRDARLLAAHSIVLTSYSTLAQEFKAFFAAAKRERAAALSQSPTAGLGCSSPLAAIHFQRIILDEGHHIKNTQALINKACNAVSADARWILTGTPLQNELSDAFALLQFLRVSPMGCRRWWKENVAALEERGMMADAVRTVRRSLLPVMLRRQGSDLDEEGRPLLALPRLTIHTFTLQLTCGERAFYQTVFEKSKAEFEELLLKNQVWKQYQHVLLLLLRLRQASSHPMLPTYAEEMRRLELMNAICEESAGLGTPATLASPAVRDLLADLKKGKINDCPVCLEKPLQAVALTTCWHTLCLQCVTDLHLQSQTRNKDTSANCPVCARPFSEQNVQRLPPLPATPQAESWRHVVRRRLSEEASCPRGELSLFKSSHTPEHSHSTDGTSIDDFLPDAKALGKAELQAATKDAFFFSTKIRVLLALLEADVKAGRSCVVFSQWNMMLDLVEQAIEQREALPNRQVREGPVAETPEQTASPSKGLVQSAPPCSSRTRIFYYRRVDGTLSLEARRRVIEWFMRSRGAGGSWSSPVAADESPSFKEKDAAGDQLEVGGCENPFMGTFPSGPFAPCASQNQTCEVDKEKKSRLTSSLNKPFSAAAPRHLGQVLLFSLKTGCVGLNLTAATRGYLLDNWWNPQVENQAMRRLWRFGQRKPVEIFRFVCARTVEERIEEVLKYKGWLSDGCLEDNVLAEDGPADDDEHRRSTLSLKDLKKLFEGWELEEEEDISQQPTCRTEVAS